MSEKKESPHGKGRYGEKQQRNLIGGIELPTQRRRRLDNHVQKGPGIFDEQTTALDVLQTEQEPARKFWFKRGTGFYSIDYPVPRSIMEEENRRAGKLEEAQEIEIDPSNLIFSEKLNKWTLKAKKEHKSKLYGAFVIALIHTKRRDGEDIVTKRFISLKDLQKPKDNPFARFKEATR